MKMTSLFMIWKLGSRADSSDRRLTSCMTARIDRSMVTLWSPYTEIMLAGLPIGGKLMNVPLSFMICLSSSSRSVSIQSSLRGRTAVSRDMIHLLCGQDANRSVQCDKRRRVVNECKAG